MRVAVRFQYAVLFEGLTGNGHRQTAGVGEIRLPELTRRMSLAEHDLLLGAVDGPRHWRTRRSKVRRMPEPQRLGRDITAV